MESNLILLGDELFSKGDVKHKESYTLQGGDLYTRWLVSCKDHYWIISILTDDNSNVIYRGLECFNSIQRAVDVYFSINDVIRNDDGKEVCTW